MSDGQFSAIVSKRLDKASDIPSLSITDDPLVVEADAALEVRTENRRGESEWRLNLKRTRLD